MAVEAPGNGSRVYFVQIHNRTYIYLNYWDPAIARTRHIYLGSPGCLNIDRLEERLTKALPYLTDSDRRTLAEVLLKLRARIDGLLAQLEGKSTDMVGGFP